MVPRQIFAGGFKKAGSIVAIIAYAFTTRFNLLLFSYYVSLATGWVLDRFRMRTLTFATRFQHLDSHLLPGHS